MSDDRDAAESGQENSDTYLRGFAKGIVNVFTGGAAVLDEQLQRAAPKDDDEDTSIERRS